MPTTLYKAKNLKRKTILVGYLVSWLAGLILIHQLDNHVTI